MDNAQLLREVVLLRADIALLRADMHRRAPTRDQDIVLGKLLQVVHDAIGGRMFSAGELLVHVEKSNAKDLRAAILAAVGDANSRKVGKALARAEGRDLGGYMVKRAGSDASGILWFVDRV